jgi:hypothetical protein
VYRVKSRHRYQPGGGFLLSPDAIGAAGAEGSPADLFSINNCPATNITAANAIANIAVAN